MEYTNIPKEKFRFADPGRRTGDKKFDTKQMSYAKDVFTRFCKNKSSVVAGVIIILLVLFAIFVPMFCETQYSLSLTDTKYLEYKYFLPKAELFENAGFWDGGKDRTLNESDYLKQLALAQETGNRTIIEVYKAGYQTLNVAGAPVDDTKYYDVRWDSYGGVGMLSLDLTPEEFKDMQDWQLETGIQVIYPAVDYKAKDERGKNLIIDRLHGKADIWYATDSKGNPKLDKDGNFISVYATTDSLNYSSIRYTDPNYYDYYSKRVDGDDGTFIYAQVGTATVAGKESINYSVRVDKYAYFQYRYGHEPSFLFGTNEKGQDILTRLASGARFSLVLAVCISAVNLFIGAIYGAIEGFYGGIVDLTMERISDILGGIPSMVVMSLFQLHLASKVGPVWSLVFAFVLTGWLGMAGRTRMQFYRFKRQEYVLSARTLGASDSRLMFKHIFPNAMGTLITGSVLSIPGVIFSESSLTYLGIVNLEGSTQTSVGTLLSNASSSLTSNPHLILFPALFISLLEISFNLFGNGLRDAFNPSLKGIED